MQTLASAGGTDAAGHWLYLHWCAASTHLAAFCSVPGALHVRVIHGTQLLASFVHPHPFASAWDFRLWATAGAEVLCISLKEDADDTEGSAELSFCTQRGEVLASHVLPAGSGCAFDAGRCRLLTLVDSSSGRPQLRSCGITAATSWTLCLRAPPQVQQPACLALAPDGGAVIAWRMGLTASDVVAVDLSTAYVTYHPLPASRCRVRTKGLQAGQAAFWAPEMAVGRHSVALAHCPGDRLHLMDVRPGRAGRLLWQSTGVQPASDPTGTYFAVVGPEYDTINVLHALGGVLHRLPLRSMDLAVHTVHAPKWLPEGRGLCCTVATGALPRASGVAAWVQHFVS